MSFLAKITDIACEASQQDWNKSEYKEIYIQAFIAGAEYVNEEYQQREKHHVRQCKKLGYKKWSALHVITDLQSIEKGVNEQSKPDRYSIAIREMNE